MINPLISIIIPLYNSEKFINSTIKSILGQTYENFELIIIDDASTDGSTQLVKNFIKIDNRIKLIQLNSNFGGPARPRNIGLDESKGTFIAFCDNDDIWEKNKLEIQLNEIQKNEYNFCFSDIQLIDEKNNILNLNIVKKMTKLIFFYPTYFKLFFSNQISLSSVLIEKEFLGPYKFDEDINLIACEDYLLWLTLFRKKNIKFHKIKDKLVKYRVVRNSASSNSLRQQIIALHTVTKHLINEKDFSSYAKLILVTIFFALKAPWFLISNYHFIKTGMNKNN